MGGEPDHRVSFTGLHGFPAPRGAVMDTSGAIGYFRGVKA